MRRISRFLSLLLSLCMLASIVPMEVFAVQTEKTENVSSWQEFKAALEDETVTVISMNEEIKYQRGEFNGDDALMIERDVTIRGNGNLLSLDCGGIILGGNVTFENIVISFNNSVRNAVVANGYTLTLDGVTKYSGTRQSVHLFCGEITDYNGTNKVPESGGDGKVIIRGASELGEIYAGSLSDGATESAANQNDFSGASTIVVESSTTGTIGAVYAHGAREPRGEGEGNALVGDPSKYTVSGQVNIILNSNLVKTVDGNTGGSAGAALTYNYSADEYLQYGLTFTNLSSLILEDGHLQPKSGSSFTEGASLTIGEKGILDLQKYDDLTVGDFSGGGKLVLGQEQILAITGRITGATEAYIGSVYANQQAMPRKGHAYIRIFNGSIPSGSEFVFAENPNYAALTPVYDSSGGCWKVPSDPESTDEIIISDITIGSSFLATVNETELIIPIESTYSTRPNQWGALELVPLKVWVNGTQAVQEANDYNGYAYRTDSLLISPQPDDEDYSKDVIWIESSGGIFEPLPKGEYNILIQIPSAYMEDKVNKELRFSVTIADDGQGAEKNTPIAVPIAKNGLIYNGNEQIGVPEGTGYSLSNHKKTDAGEYEAVAVLESGYEWSTGSTASLRIVWEIAKAAGKGSVTLKDWIYGEEVSKPILQSSTHSTQTGITYEYKRIEEEDAAFKPFILGKTIESGEYTLRATFAENRNYEKLQVRTTFVVKEAPAVVYPNGIWIEGIEDVSYTGTAQQQTFTVGDGSTLLKEGVDYTVSYKNNVNAYAYAQKDAQFNAAKAPQVILKMKGNYSGTRSVYFKILPLDISNGDSFEAENPVAIATGRSLAPKVVIKNNETGKALNLNKDYDAYVGETGQGILLKNYNQFIEAKDYTITLVGKGNYTGSRKITYSIKEKDEAVVLSKATIKAIANQRWEQGVGTEDNKRFTPELTVTYGSAKTALIQGEEGDYTVKWVNNDRVGTATVILTGTGKDANGDGISHVGSVSRTFKITGTSMSSVTVNQLNKQGYSYTGLPICPTAFEGSERVTLSYRKNKTDSWIALKENMHYTVSYSKNTDKGTATITFTGRPEAGYIGVKKQTFKILGQNIQEAGIEITNTPVLYTAGGAVPDIIVNWRGSRLTEGVDYTVSYRNNKQVYATNQNDEGFSAQKAPAVIIKGKGNFTGTASQYFTILPKSISSRDIRVSAEDKVDNGRVNNWLQSFKVYDVNGKALTANEYDKNATYWLKEDATGREAGKQLNPKDKTQRVEPGSVIEIRVKDNEKNGLYIGGEDDCAVGTYRILEKGYDIKNAVISIQPQYYTGKPVEIADSRQFTAGKLYLKINGNIRELKLGTDFEVVEGSYVNNMKKGTARVTFRGIGDFGGTKTVSFKIQQRSITSDSVWKGEFGGSILSFFQSNL